jgi:hypothetical protein
MICINCGQRIKPKLTPIIENDKLIVYSDKFNIIHVRIFNSKSNMDFRKDINFIFSEMSLTAFKIMCSLTNGDLKFRDFVFI